MRNNMHYHALGALGFDKIDVNQEFHLIRVFSILSRNKAPKAETKHPKHIKHPKHGGVYYTN